MSEKHVQNVEKANVPTISAEELHRIVLRALRVNNLSRHKLILTLLILSEGKLYVVLGYSSMSQYAGKTVGYGRTKTFESLRVARALPNLPVCTALFDKGELTWSTLREISRVAKPETEKEWIEFAKDHTYRQLQLEVQDALGKKRDRPRKDGHGLTNLITSLKIDLTLEELNIVKKAFEKIASEMRESLGEDLEGGEMPIGRKEVLLYIAQLILKTDLPNSFANRKEREEGIHDLVFRLCPECREKAAVMTPEGPVEVPAEHAIRIEGDARKTEIRPEEEKKGVVTHGDGAVKVDRPNPASLARKVKLRDGRRCMNPGCCRVS